jgi:hypothetical protein
MVSRTVAAAARIRDVSCVRPGSAPAPGSPPLRTRAAAGAYGYSLSEMQHAIGLRLAGQRVPRA